MKKELFIICIVGMFLASGLLGASSVNTAKVNNILSDGNDLYDEVGTSAVGYSNEAYFGESWSINREKSFGAADLYVEKDVSATWIAENNEANNLVNINNLTEFEINTIKNKLIQINEFKTKLNMDFKGVNL